MCDVADDTQHQMESTAIDPDLVVLHTLRCSGAMSLERLSGVVTALVPVDVEDVLLGLAGRGFVTRGGGPFGGWRLTDAGRDADGGWIAVELDRAGARAEVETAYDDFMPLNRRVLDICGEWQVRSAAIPMVLNDHSDAEYDAGVLDRLAELDAAAQPVCARLATSLPRFSHYGPRLAAALAAARAGAVDKVADSLDSYHAVWFQLHEDLLVTLGRSREA